MDKKKLTQKKNGKGYEQAIHTNGKDKERKKCLDSYPKLSNTKISLIPIILARILKSSDIY